MTDGTSETQGPAPEFSQPDSGAPEAKTEVLAASDQATTRPKFRRSRGMATTVFKAIANIVSVAAIIYFTYFFTIFFAKKSHEPAPVPESVRAAAKKNEDLRAEERRLVTTYGVVNPALKSVRIPVERAMELIAAESAQPPAAASPAPKAEVAVPTDAAAAQKGDQPATSPVPVASAATPPPMPATPTATSSSAPSAGLAPVGMAPEVLYRAICIACHDADGRGGIVRKAMPVIPDFTDAKWQRTRTDAELQHSILEGKGQLMLTMKDKFALAHTDPKAMVAFVRGFQPGATAATGSPSATVADATAGASGVTPITVLPAPRSNVAMPTVTTGTPASTSIPAAPLPASASVVVPTAAGVAPGSSSAALALSAPLPPEALALLAPPPPVASTPAHTTSVRGIAPSPATAARLRAASEMYRINCVACHGPDGRGSLMRAAMPAIPDFTAGAWQSSRDSIQLSIGILEGKGTLMPPWRGKVSPEQARDLVSYLRTLGPPNLVAAEVPPSEFGNRFRLLTKQWDDLERQARSLSGP